MSDLGIRGGIRSRLTTGSSDTAKLNWWGKRWIEVLDSCVDHSRYTRGKTCAKKGHVISLDIEPGLVSALVQGERHDPYIVRCGFNTITPEAHELFMFRLRERSVFAAELLAGRMPHEMEEVFLEAGVRLFPNQMRLRTFKCTCPSDDTICEHIVAVYMLLGEAFSNDPFLMLYLYGIDKELLIKNLSGEIKGGDDEDEYDSDRISGGSKMTNIEFPEEEEDLNCWYGNGDYRIPNVRECKKPEAYSVMHEFPFWRGVNPFLETIKEYYVKAANYSYEILTGEKRVTVGRPKKFV